MDASDVIVGLERLEIEAISHWLDGGWGVDALVGSQTRPHHDLDLVLVDADCPRARKALSSLGYTHDPSEQPGLPARLVLRDRHGHQVDIHPIVCDAHGNGWQPLGSGAWGAYPAEGLTAVGAVAQRQVRCITPELQLRHHLGYSYRETDRHDLRLLRDHFGLALPPGV
jgi:lincosamide nucleotidyltransferase A/C/D/E